MPKYHEECGNHGFHCMREGCPGHDEEVRTLFVTLIGFVASARASHDSKNEALDAIQKLQARLLP